MSFLCAEELRLQGIQFLFMNLPFKTSETTKRFSLKLSESHATGDYPVVSVLRLDVEITPSSLWRGN
jgi:hypothetical protein